VLRSRLLIGTVRRLHEGVRRQLHYPSEEIETMTAQVTTDLIITELRVLPTQDRLLGLYELGLGGCERGDAGQVRAVLLELLASLDFGYAEVAEAFHQLYSYCLAQCSRGALDAVSFVFEDLRTTLLRAAEDTRIDRVASA
jgi:hypothetical protein